MRGKKALLAIGGTVVGLATLRSVRKRRARSTEPETRDVAHEDPTTAREHAEAAAEHARLAAEQTSER